ncbi:coiled-coil domain-containing protein 190 [Hemicordylus capensis]|uniref:coiled-coil domain-containing protein 190 n=1 Tax=Hemicordylus capensis TaxID=884348 RepID=UPI0023047F36|nr:coiled-coil domain-containing protein 190 [Hemicordylus capensis]XP_053106130.1 coiled-coil domain-containing protein 190 [Hemicordylus capensis]XP_053106131.1 coiled-coil domain-containing protein 190 [Hemicordylus capensis]XP_053106133.1 coiled-coil domain-containing protein 190 [Hemicordylus capensis]XP_053106134.1 coiled-coil domain-containing protein 190 [Hemicordylus capensis]XP_053106135.1 coiled-coil domain-containing protein 190 [Hemicordylus capensis]XP_053106136.1 coiled-coil do
MAEGESSRHWEAERRDVKRAEARLNRGLRNLEDARLSYLNSMTKEQRRLQQELLKLQESCSKQKLSVGARHISTKPLFPLLSPQTGQDYLSSYDATLWSRKKLLPKAGRPLGASCFPSHLQTLNSDVSGYEGDRKEHLPSLKAKDQNNIADSNVATLKHSIAKLLSISAESAEQEETDSKEDQEKGPSKEEARAAGAKGTIPKLLNLPGKQRPSIDHERLILDAEAYGVDGRLRTMYTRPEFLKSYAEARKARYIRHKDIPAWEKELSLQEIFGHKRAVEHSPQE